MDPELEVEVKWLHVVGGFDAAVANATGGTAMEQLTANSEESLLRLGDIRACRRMLSDFPLRVDVKRVSIREVQWPDQKLFRVFPIVLKCTNMTFKCLYLIGNKL